jgi:uncharacterized membrane protein
MWVGFSGHVPNKITRLFATRNNLSGMPQNSNFGISISQFDANTSRWIAAKPVSIKK